MSIRNLVNLVNTTMPYAWDDSLSVYEMLGKLIRTINEVVDLVNEKLPDDFETAFYNKFREYTAAEMQAIIDSGEFAAILDSMIVEFSPIKQEVIDARDGEVSVGAKIRSVDSQLAQAKNDITTHLNIPNIHKPIKVFEREPNSGAINNGDLLFIYDNLVDWTPTKWEVGSLASATGLPNAATNRVRTIDYISITPGEYKSLVTGPTINPWDIEVGTVNYLFYTESNSFIFTTGWIINGSNITIPINTVKMRVVIRIPTDTDVDVNLAKDTIKPVLTKIYG